MEVIVGSVTSLQRWSDTKKGILSLCAEGGRTKNFKAVLRQINTVKICRKKVYQFYVQRGRLNNFRAELMQIISVKIQKNIC